MAILLQYDVFGKDLMTLTVATIPFFLTTLESYYTGTLSMPALNAANEGNMCIAIFFLAGALFGSEVYQLPLGSFYGQDMRLSELFLYTAALLILCNSLYNYF